MPTWKRWKAHELKVAKQFGLQRNARTGKNAGDLTEHSLFSIEVKYRKTLPKFLLSGLEQAKSYDPKKAPMLVMKQRAMRGEIVSMYLKDFVDLFGKVL